MRSHFVLSPRAAMACAVSGGMALLPGVSSAAPIAADSPIDPVYADGWQAGDNGGFGFSAWNMNGTYNSAVQHTMDSASPYNQLGLAWTLYNPNGTAAGTSNPPEGGSDISRAGRGFSPLQVGDTISATIDNPTERSFFRGYTVRLVSGGQNTTYGGTAVSRLAVGTFEYFTNGLWYTNSGSTSLFDLDTDAGMLLDVTLTGLNSYSLTMTPLDNPVIAYTQSGSLAGSGAIDWIQFELYNTDSDFNPSAVLEFPQATDFYIGGITIVPEPSSFALVGLGSVGLLCLRLRSRYRSAKPFV